MKKPLSRSGFFMEDPTELLQLGFLVFDMLASFGIKFHDRHFLGHGFLVLAGGVEVTRTRRRFKLDFFASAFGSHGEILSVCVFSVQPDGANASDGVESGLTAGAQIGEHHFNAFFVDQAQCGVGHAQTHPAVFAFDPKTAVLQVGQKTALGFVVGVGDIVSHHRAFTRDFTYA
jgi:hypothetical protein